MYPVPDSHRGGVASSLARRRPAVFPFPSPATIQVAEGYAGFAILCCQKPPPPAYLELDAARQKYPWYKITAVVGDAETTVQFEHDDAGVLVVDFKEGFIPSPESLQFYAHQYYVQFKAAQAAAPALAPTGTDVARVAAAPAGGVAPPTGEDGTPGDSPIVT
jgi:hypothetical protein